MPTPRLMLLIVEMRADTEEEADDVLDSFRESVLPQTNYQLLICRASGEDVARFPTPKDALLLVPTIRGEV